MLSGYGVTPVPLAQGSGVFVGVLCGVGVVVGLCIVDASIFWFVLASCFVSVLFS